MNSESALKHVTINKKQETKGSELTPEALAVLREGATERPFTSPLLKVKEQGMFRCAGCGAQLFASDTKFDSGTGWPSFTQAIPGAVKYVEDRTHGMTRTEVCCTKCDGHLGHVFDDGPRAQGGKRFCINGCALDFTKE